MGTLIRRARLATLVATTTVLLIGALLVGWFVPHDRYDILAELLIVAFASLAALFQRLAWLQQEVDMTAECRRQAEADAHAFHNPEYDYDQRDWRRANAMSRVPRAVQQPNAETLQTSSVRA